MGSLWEHETGTGQNKGPLWLSAAFMEGAWVGTLRRILQLKGTQLLIDPALCLNAYVGSAGVVTGDSGTGACAMQIAECTPKRLPRLLYPVPYE